MSLKIEDLVSEAPLPQARDYVVYPWLLPGRLTLLVGPTEAGKTTLTLEVIAATLKGEHLWDRLPARKVDRVLYLHGEHTLATVQEAAKLRSDIPQGSVAVVHDFGDSPSLIENGRPRAHLIKQLYELISDMKPSLIIAEPISAFLGASENDNREARVVINILSTLGAKVNAAVLTHHHVGKVHFDQERQKPQGIPGGEARGAMAFEDAAERVIYLRRSGKKELNHIKLETPKSKGFPVSDIILSFDEDTLRYDYVSIPAAERDLISIYDRRRKRPDESIRDMIEYFRLSWPNGASPNKVMLLLKRCITVGLLNEEYIALV